MKNKKEKEKQFKGKTTEELIAENPYNPLLGLVIGVKQCPKCGRYYIPPKEPCYHQTMAEWKLEKINKIFEMIENNEISIEELKGIIKLIKLI
jgi:hypothetical protein